MVLNPRISTTGTITSLLTELTEDERQDHDIWRWKCRSWLGTDRQIG